MGAGRHIGDALGRRVLNRKELTRAFDVCVCKTHTNIRRLAAEPKSAAWAVDGNYFRCREGFYEISNWTSSFFTGMALLAWQETKDEYFLQQVFRLMPNYREKVFNHFLSTQHDLGFLYSLFSVPLYKLTGDKEHRAVGLRAAKILAERFGENGGYIRAWGQVDTCEHNNLAVITSLMNLPLLYWASIQVENDSFQKIAVRHAEMTVRHFIRPDDSVCSGYRFKLRTGAPASQVNACAGAKNSFWARGAAWAIYGLALSYRHTGDAMYLNSSLRVARRFIAELDDEIVPVWDFRLSNSKPRWRDSSAAAIAVCGFQELARLGVTDTSIGDAKHALLGRLCSLDYLNADEDCAGILRRGQVGNAVNAYTSWGDYFLMQSLATELGMKPLLSGDMACRYHIASQRSARVIARRTPTDCRHSCVKVAACLPRTKHVPIPDSESQ